jgi:hypothetical protein
MLTEEIIETEVPRNIPEAEVLSGNCLISSLMKVGTDLA